jgi:hypothetical protein
MSAGWYTKYVLNDIIWKWHATHIKILCCSYYAKRDWQVYYETDPTNFSGSPAQHALVTSDSFQNDLVTIIVRPLQVQGGEFSQWDNYDSVCAVNRLLYTRSIFHGCRRLRASAWRGRAEAP